MLMIVAGVYPMPDPLPKTDLKQQPEFQLQRHGWKKLSAKLEVLNSKTF